MICSSANPQLNLDRAALAANWRWFAAASGAADCGAAIKADGYGLGAVEVFATLANAGCRDFFVAHWSEAQALGALPENIRLAVLHGVQPGEMAHALTAPARPVLCTPQQVSTWKAAGGGTCDVMVDTGMSRLGLSLAEAVSGLLDDLKLDTLHSHLACSEDPAHPMNQKQLADFQQLVATIRPKRAALANSGGVMLGPEYCFSLTRPGLGLYGGQAVDGQQAPLQQVVRIEARVVQIRAIPAGASIGYGASYVTRSATNIAVLGLGYADGYARSFAGTGHVKWADRVFPVVGRVSMDLVCVVIGTAPVTEGDWLEIDFDLPNAALAAGRAQYELLTSLGHRYERIWR
jgi:alanine racemase